MDVGVRAVLSGWTEAQQQIGGTAKSLDGLKDSAEKASGKGGTGGLADMGRGAKAANDNLAGLHRQASAVGAVLGSALVVGAIAATGALFQAGAQAEKFRISFQAATGSVGDGARALQFVRGLSDEMGVSFTTTAAAFLKFSAAAQGSALQGERAKEIFTAFAGAARVLGLSASETSGVFLALEQMISKGKVSAEELRGQLGERLPGAFRLAAEAMGITTAELDKALKSGTITAEELLPKLAARVTEVYGNSVPAAARTAAAELERVNNEWERLKENTANSTGFMTAAAGSLSFLSSTIRQLGKSMDDNVPTLERFRAALPFAPLGLGNLIRPMLPDAPGGLQDQSVIDSEVQRLLGRAPAATPEATKTETDSGKRARQRELERLRTLELKSAVEDLNAQQSKLDDRDEQTRKTLKAKREELERLQALQAKSDREDLEAQARKIEESDTMVRESFKRQQDEARKTAEAIRDAVGTELSFAVGSVLKGNQTAAEAAGAFGVRVATRLIAKFQDKIVAELERAIVKPFEPILKKIGDIFGDLWSSVVKDMKGIFSSAWEWLKGLFSGGLGNLISNIGNGISSVFGGGGGSIGGLLGGGSTVVGYAGSGASGASASGAMIGGGAAAGTGGSAAAGSAVGGSTLAAAGTFAAMGVAVAVLGPVIGDLVDSALQGLGLTSENNPWNSKTLLPKFVGMVMNDGKGGVKAMDVFNYAVSQGMSPGSLSGKLLQQAAAQGWASGTSGSIYTSPSMIMVGEAGPEQVTVSPMAGAAHGRGSVAPNFIFQGPVIMDPYTQKRFARMMGRM